MMIAAIAWLNDNSGAVTAMAAVIGVLVTAVYAFFTIQAHITRRIFEASHRPYVTTEVREPTVTGTHGRVSFAIAFENSGTVPADITAWEVHGTLMDLEGLEQPVNRVDPIESPVGRSLGPQERAMIELHFVAADLPNPTLPFRLRGKVEYRGVASWTYATEFNAERVRESWKTQGRRMRLTENPS